MNEENIGIILKELRQKEGLTQKDIAKRLIITPQTISKWENGISSPSLEMLVALSDIYNVSIDELLKGSKESNDITVIKENGNVRFSIALFVILGIMVALGILSMFFDYAELWITKIQIDQSTAQHVYPAYYIIDEKIDLTMMVTMIASPIIIALLSFLDKRKFVSLIVSNIVLIYLISTLGTYMGHPEFHEARLGMFLVFIYVVFLLITIGLQLLLSKSNIVYKLVEDKTYLTFGFAAYIIALALPFTYRFINYYEHWEDPFIDAFTYYETLDQVIVLMMMVLGTLVLLKSYKVVKEITTVYSLLMIVMLLWTTIVYIFNGGLIIPSVIMYVYLLLLGITFEKEDFNLFKKKHFPISVLTILEVVSIGFYIYLLTLDGDLFFNYNEVNTDLDYTIGNRNFKYGSLIALHLILLVVPMFFRFVKLHKLSITFYAIWVIFECWFLYDMYQTYIKPGYRMTDGMLYFIPPILIGVYGFIKLVIMIFRKFRKIKVY